VRRLRVDGAFANRVEVRIMRPSVPFVFGVIAALAGPAFASAAAVTIADKNLEAALKAVLHDPKDGLTEENLANVHILDAPGKDIKDLSGLEKCKNLAKIKFSKNQISDLKPLKDMANLQSLDLSGNKITDLAALAGLTKLQYLELSNNQIADLKPLGGLAKLSALTLSGNKVSDLGPLAGLTELSSLYLDHNQIADVAPLAKLTKLSTLNLKDNQIKDLGPVAKQTELRMLILEKNKIADLTPLVNAAKEDAEKDKRFAPYLRLYLKDNPLSDDAKTKQLEALKSFGVHIES
jgi:Leucine-rich repeat (LRR) protein